MLSSEYEKVSTDLKRSFQTALPISSSRNMKLEKRTNDSKPGQKSRLNLRQILKDLKKSEESRKSYIKTVAIKRILNLLIKNYYVKQNILTKMIELRLNREVTNFPLIIN